MSVTFTVQGSPMLTTTEVCYCVEPTGANPECQFCEGSGEEKHSVVRDSHNFGNSNARAVLGALGLDTEELYGSLSGSDIATVRQRAMVALNSSKRRAPHLRESVTGGTGGGHEANGNVTHINFTNYVAMGLNDEGLMTRIDMLDSLLEIAQDRSVAITWS